MNYINVFRFFWFITENPIKKFDDPASSVSLVFKLGKISLITTAYIKHFHVQFHSSSSLSSSMSKLSSAEICACSLAFDLRISFRA